MVKPAVKEDRPKPPSVLHFCRFLVSTVVLAGAHQEVDGVRKEKERLTTDHLQEKDKEKKIPWEGEFTFRSDS